MTDHELDRMMEELSVELRQLGIPVSQHIFPQVQVNTRAKRRLGCCKREGNSFRIEISHSLLPSPNKVREVLVHELLHTCPGCGNHGKTWKRYGELAGKALGVTVSRLSPAEGDGRPLRREEVKYVLECQSCGAKIGRSRMSKAVKSPWRYRCPCGGKLKRIQ